MVTGVVLDLTRRPVGCGGSLGAAAVVAVGDLPACVAGRGPDLLAGPGAGVQAGLGHTGVLLGLHLGLVLRLKAQAVAVVARRGVSHSVCHQKSLTEKKATPQKLPEKTSPLAGATTGLFFGYIFTRFLTPGVDFCVLVF